uniref:7S globulin n=1 Tax=Elaeis guineensis var. tenera TaxID=51953 RepID=Q9AU64_ELAGV|nr:7S globulin [Elaeis guineensis]
MTIKPRAFVPFLLLLSILFVSATLTFSATTEDPKQRLERCKQECRESRQGERQERRCVSQCEERYERERREQEERKGQGEERGRREEPEKRLEECRRECREQAERRERRECEKRCEEEYKEHRGRSKDKEEGEEGRGEKRRESDPYFFDEESFLHRVRTEHGHVRVLRNFLEKSKLLLGVANYRVAILETNPNTFVLPSHWDAEALLFVARGHGHITLQCQDNKATHELRRGDIMRVRAGTIVSFANRGVGNEKLVIVILLHPVATPGMFEAFVGAGGQNPESFYRSFSKRVLSAAFNTREDKLERLFQKQNKGAIIQASQEQIKEMSRGSEGRSWPFGESRRPFNLFHKRPAHSNRHGELREADSDDYPELRDLNIHVSYANISKGSMIAPNYNTEATKISVVVGGNGDVQIVCPHISRQQEEGRRGREEEEGRGRQEGREEEEEEEQQQRGQHYRRVESKVSCGTTFIVPAGHPSVSVSSRNENLEVLCFEINAKNNQRTWLAGRNNVLKQMDRVTKELAFDLPEREVDEVLNAPREEVFMAGPEERGRERERGEGRDGPLESILEFAGF